MNKISDKQEIINKNRNNVMFILISSPIINKF
jgi:hypothetical protein